MRYPVFTHMVANISVFLAENRDNCIGTSPHCQLVLHDEQIEDMHAVVKRSEGNWQLTVVRGEGKVNEKVLFSCESHDIFPGDRIVFGSTLLLFQLLEEAGLPTLEDNTRSKAFPRVRESSPGTTQEQVATESFHIITDDRIENPTYLHKKVVAICCALLIFVGISYLLVTGKLSRYREHLNSTVAEEASSDPFAPERIVENTDLPHVVEKVEKTTTMTADGWQSLPVEWVLVGDIELVKIVDEGPLQQQQEEIFEKFRRGQFRQAQALYSTCVFDEVCTSLVRFKNVLRYNGLAFRWLAMLDKAKDEKYKHLRKRLRKEVEIVSKQVKTNLENQKSKTHFENLLEYIRQRIPE